MKTAPFLKPLLASSALLFLLAQCEPKNNFISKEPEPHFAPRGQEHFLQTMQIRFQEAAALLARKNDKEIPKKLADIHLELSREFPVFYDWWLQDGGEDINWFQDTFEEQGKKRLSRVAADLKKSETERGELTLQDYLGLCKERRFQRLSKFIQTSPTVIFTKFKPWRPSFYAYTEGASDARGECNFTPGGELALLKMQGIWAQELSLIKDEKGLLRDPNVHFDGEHVLFSWKKSAREDDYHLYEINLKSGEQKQITSGRGCADIEGIYLPDNNILFNSTRCGSSVDCWFTEVSNLYLCDRDGQFIRRVGFDQVHTTSPSLLDDGRVVYTRWDYNDRGQVFTQPLFQMFPDGTAQSAYYGINSWFPTTLVHPRQIPGTRKVMATAIGHHTPQHGKLAVIDPEAGREENEGVTFVAPLRTPKPERIDQYGQYGEQFQYPFPLNETDFLISYTPLGYHTGPAMNFGIYWMNLDGKRELLVSDPGTSCNQPQPVLPRKRPFRRFSDVDYTQNTGTYYLQNIYEGESMKGVAPGSVKKLRIVELEYRPAGIGQAYSVGKGGAGHASSPVGVGNASWDVKKVHGTVDVSPDGSAFFKVPARKPLYFQALDGNGMVIQTMRSWSTLQPGEFQSCVGCHEHKNTVPLTNHPLSQSMDRELQNIIPEPGGLRGFSFIDEVQPILDKHCISCHDGAKQKMSLKGDLKVVDKQTKRQFSDAYLNLTHARKTSQWNDSWQGQDDHPEVNWVSNQSEPSALPPRSAGAARSGLIKRLREGHGKTKLTSEEINRFIMWLDLAVPFIGDYTAANNWTDKEKEFYERYRKKREQFDQEDRKSILRYIQSLTPEKQP